MVLLASEYNKLRTGDIAPSFSLPATDGKNYSLSAFDKNKAILVIFMCNHCPFVVPKIAEINRIARDFKHQGVAVIGINPNEAEGYPEDSFDRMKEYMKEWSAEFIYLCDESQDTAKAYGAVCTPDPFFFVSDKGTFKLLFHSRIDDTHGDKKPTYHEMYDAIKEFLETGTISLKEQPSMGCSIKWK